MMIPKFLALAILAFALISIAIGSAFLVYVHLINPTGIAPPSLPSPPKNGKGTVLGRRGQWVTRPDGRRVCRLSADLMITHRIDPSFCTEWQEPEPAIGQPVEGWMRVNPAGTGHQIMIDGSWRP